jgi:nucleotide-binding universal stress UspA family protein
VAGLIVIGYDGSADARHAIDATRMLNVEAALVVHVWQRSPGVAPPTMPLGAATVPSQAEDERLEEQARRVAAEGAARVEAVGIRAEAVVVSGDSKAHTGQLLAELADERSADAIVVGRRGVSRLEAVVLGSVSDAAVRAAHRPVLVVPAPED